MDQSIDWRPFNFHGLSKLFISLAIPNAPLWKPDVELSSRCGQQEVQEILSKVANGSITLDRASKLVFGMPSYAHLAERYLELSGTTTFASSKETVDRIKSLRWNGPSTLMYRTLDPNGVIFDLCKEFGRRCYPDGWDPPWDILSWSDAKFDDCFTHAAVLGFHAIETPLRVPRERIESFADPKRRTYLRSIVAIESPLAKQPFDALPSEFRKYLSVELRRQAKEITTLLRTEPRTVDAGSKSIYECLVDAARRGSSLAAIAFDASEVKYFERPPFPPKRVKISTLDDLP